MQCQRKLNQECLSFQKRIEYLEAKQALNLTYASHFSFLNQNRKQFSTVFCAEHGAFPASESSVKDITAKYSEPQVAARNGKKGGNGVSESRMQTGGIGLSLLHHVNI